jgi:hypothetical protein
LLPQKNKKAFLLWVQQSIQPQRLKTRIER